MFVYFFCGQCAQPMASFHYSKILLNCQAIIFLAFDFRNYFVEEMNVYSSSLFIFPILSHSSSWILSFLSFILNLKEAQANVIE